MYDLDDIEKDDDQQDELPEFMKPEDTPAELDAVDAVGPPDSEPDEDDDNHGNR